MTEVKIGDRLLVTKEYLACPYCRRNKRLLRVRSDTTADRLQLYCKDCKHSILVRIDGGRVSLLERPEC